MIRNLHERVIDAKILTGANKGDLVLIPRLKLAPSDVNLPFTLERTQFPLRLSYCMTINKSQGQTFSRKNEVKICEKAANNLGQGNSVLPFTLV